MINGKDCHELFKKAVEINSDKKLGFRYHYYYIEKTISDYKEAENYENCFAVFINPIKNIKFLKENEKSFSNINSCRLITTENNLELSYQHEIIFLEYENEKYMIQKFNVSCFAPEIYKLELDDENLLNKLKMEIIL